MSTDRSPAFAWRRQREARGISLRRLAELTGINRGRLSYIERGISPTPDEARRIIAALARPNTQLQMKRHKIRATRLGLCVCGLALYQTSTGKLRHSDPRLKAAGE